MSRNALRPFLLALLATPILLAGCGRDSARDLAGPPADATLSREADATHGSAPNYVLPRVMFVHASPDAPAVDIKSGWRTLARNLGFLDNTPYRLLLPGYREIKINVAGTRTTALRARVKLEPRTIYSVFAVNTVSNLEPLVLVDDLSPPAPGNAHVRFIHLSPDAPAVDVAVQGGPVVFGNKSFKEYTAFTPLPAGTYDLEVRLAGTSTVVLPLPGIGLEAGKIYTVFAKGLVAGSGDQALGAAIVINSDEFRRWHHGAGAEPVADLER